MQCEERGDDSAARPCREQQPRRPQARRSGISSILRQPAAEQQRKCRHRRQHVVLLPGGEAEEHHRHRRPAEEQQPRPLRLVQRSVPRHQRRSGTRHSADGRNALHGSSHTSSSPQNRASGTVS